MVFGVTRSRPLHSDESSVSVDDAESVESGQLSSTVHSSTTSRAARLRHGVGRVFQTLSIPFRKIGEVRRRRRADRRLLALRLRPVREHFVHSLPTPQPVVPLAKQKMVFYSSDGDTEVEFPTYIVVTRCYIRMKINNSRTGRSRWHFLAGNILSPLAASYKAQRLRINFFTPWIR